MAKVVDISGKKFGRLTVIRKVPRPLNLKSSNARWECICDCGKIVNVISANLRNGTSSSCGCYKKEVTSMVKRTHGQSSYNKTSEYQAWKGMKYRCYNKKGDHYHLYGGRGIIVCDRWLNSFENFLQDMGKKPSSKHSLDRINNNGNYEPSNCRWATDNEQRRNNSRNVFLDYNGKRYVLTDLAKHLSVNFGCFRAMIKRKGLEETINFYIKKQNK